MYYKTLQSSFYSSGRTLWTILWELIVLYDIYVVQYDLPKFWTYNLGLFTKQTILFGSSFKETKSLGPTHVSLLWLIKSKEKKIYEEKDWTWIC